MMVFAQNAAFYTEKCTSPSLSHNFEVSWDGSNQSLQNYGSISKAIFKNYCMHAHNSLSELRCKFMKGFSHGTRFHEIS